MHSMSSLPLFKSAPCRRGRLDSNENNITTKSEVGLVEIGGVSSWNYNNNNDNNTRQSFLPVIEAAAADAVPPLVPVQNLKEWRNYPNVPYYGIIQGIQLIIKVAGPEEEIGDDLNKFIILDNLETLQKLLQDATDKYGSVFYLSSVQPSRNTILYPSNSTTTKNTTTTSSLLHSNSNNTSELDYWKYLQALHDAFKRFNKLRDECCCSSSSSSSSEFCTHHVLFVRITDHPRLKDISILLSIENSRLCFCLSASSKVTQQYFTQRAQDMGVELEWVQGSTLLFEPIKLSMSEVNPVHAIWDIFVNLPLNSITQDVNELSERFLRNLHVTILSSLPFAGCETHTPVLRLCEAGRLSSGGRRLLWSLFSPPRVVLPHFLAGLVRSLVEQSCVNSFELRLAHDIGAAGVIGGVGGNINNAEEAGRGISYLTGAHRGAGAASRASTNSIININSSGAGDAFRTFTRLSADSWLTEADRRQYGLLLEDDPIPLECEFIVESVRYSRRKMISSSTQIVMESELMQPQNWGCAFQISNHVQRVLDDEED